jgi:rhodanese-related sulfurtransferase
MKAHFISIIFISFVFLSCQGQTLKTIQTIDSKTYSDKLKTTKNPQLLDVRTPEEFSVEHLENAKNVNWFGTDFVSNVEKLDKSKSVFVYCKVGGRSAQAANKLVELGFKEIYNLEGGIMKWTGTKTSETVNKPTGISKDDFDTIIHSDKKIMVNFSAVWCAPCKKMKPYLARLKEELKDQITIVQLDADDNKSLVDSMKLDGLPVILIYENGKEIWRNIGYISEEDLKKQL